MSCTNKSSLTEGVGGRPACLQCAPHRHTGYGACVNHERAPDLTAVECSAHASRLARPPPDLSAPWLWRRRGERFRVGDTDRADACGLSFSTTALGESVRIQGELHRAPGGRLFWDKRGNRRVGHVLLAKLHLHQLKVRNACLSSG